MQVTLHLAKNSNSMSFQSISTPISQRYFSSLVFDYLNKKLDKKYYYEYPDKSGFQNTLNKIKNYKWNREQLTSILLNQAKSVSNTTPITLENIELLKQDNTFTITTGHQLCLFTGPFYVIIKIASIIQLSYQLKKFFPEYNFVPVFWLASEDHDIEEINHFYFKDNLFKWNISSHNNPVFTLSTKGLEEVYQQMKSSDFFTEEFLNLFEKAYLNHNSYVDATRYLINELFGNEGIVIIDANENKFKSQFNDVFYKDIFENKIYQDIEFTTQKLIEKKYDIQVNPRPINTFLFYDNQRFLIQKNENQYVLKNSTITFTENELKSLLNNHPELFSPNVLLRPLYQQSILPNIAYIGGSAELAYWLELSNVFEKHNIFYPLIIQRPILFFVPSSIQNKIEKLSILYNDIFENDKNKLIQSVLDKQNLSVNLDDEKNKIQEIFNQIKKITEPIEKPIISYVTAEEVKTLKAIENIEHKLNKSIKQKNQIIVNQIESIYDNFFPNNIMQDRVYNFSYIFNISKCSTIKEFISNTISVCTVNLDENFSFKIIKTQ